MLGASTPTLERYRDGYPLRRLLAEDLDLMMPDAPEELRYLWAYYCQIKRGQALTWQELQAWSQMVGIPLHGWESETIMRIEAAVQRAMADDNAS